MHGRALDAHKLEVLVGDDMLDAARTDMEI
jgi:hypothetical protein